MENQGKDVARPMPDSKQTCIRCGNTDSESILVMSIAGYDWCYDCIQIFLKTFKEDEVYSWPEHKIESTLLKWAKIDQNFDSLEWFRKIMSDIPGGF